MSTEGIGHLDSNTHCSQHADYSQREGTAANVALIPSGICEEGVIPLIRRQPSDCEPYGWSTITLCDQFKAVCGIHVFLKLIHAALYGNPFK